MYHRAEKDVAHLLLWLPKDIENNVPPFATHHCGVAGAIVVPDENGGKMLVVKEKRMNTWKLPGHYNLSCRLISHQCVNSLNNWFPSLFFISIISSSVLVSLELCCVLSCC